MNVGITCSWSYSIVYSINFIIVSSSLICVMILCIVLLHAYEFRILASLFLLAELLTYIQRSTHLVLLILLHLLYINLDSPRRGST